MSKLQSFIKNMPEKSGIYLMRDKQQKILYIGKAKNLKKRVASYFNDDNKTLKQQRLRALISDIEVIITLNEKDALLLENEKIKQYQPYFNVLLKDDKSYPYIHLTKEKHPKISLYRGAKKEGDYFGPYPSAFVVRQSISFLQKIFKIRTCADSVYKNRSRPCLEYQIKRCSAPCVNKISVDSYQYDIKMMTLFLKGRNEQVFEKITEKMQLASEKLLFEEASHYRDQLIGLRKIQQTSKNGINDDIDIVYYLEYEGVYCIQVIFIRKGKQQGQQTFFPKNILKDSAKSILTAFISQYYLDRKRPNEIIVNIIPNDKKLLEKTFVFKIKNKVQLEKKKLLKIAEINAKNNIEQKLLKQNRAHKQLLRIQKVLGLEKLPNKIECFDISHTMGENTVASCVVFKQGKADKKSYRIFNINNIIAGDDYAAMKQVILRRYKKIKLDNKPDLILIDGGVGQLKQAQEILQDLKLDIKAIGVAKGKGRKAGLETLININNDELQKIKLPFNDLALLLINHIRDESHRFAITKHRKKQIKTKNHSFLENIEGIGNVKRKSLLHHFGGMQEIKNADITQLIKVKGINNKLAEKIIKSINS